MIARARRKAERANLSIDFQVEVIERLSFPPTGDWKFNPS